MPKKKRPRKTDSETVKEQEISHYQHAHLYYVMMVVSMIFMVLVLVQGILYHVEREIYFALSCYTIAVLLLIIAKSSHTRGKGHYHYHSHL